MIGKIITLGLGAHGIDEIITLGYTSGRDIRSGGAVKKRIHKTYKKPTKKVFTEEELQGLIAFGNAQMGVKKEEKVIETALEPINEAPVFIPETGDISLINFLPEVIESKVVVIKEENLKIDDDIALILALITAHNS